MIVLFGLVSPHQRADGGRRIRSTLDPCATTYPNECPCMIDISVNIIGRPNCIALHWLAEAFPLTTTSHEE